MNVVFLDFDGVITTPQQGWKIELPLVKRIKKICDKANAKLVISSSWQTGNSAEEWLQGCLMKRYTGPIKKFFIEYTYDVTGSHGGNRGEQIQNWLNRHNEVDNYVIIDDETDMLNSQLFHFVQTDWVFGIQDREVILAIEVLNNVEPRNSMCLNDVLKFKRWVHLNYRTAVDNYEEIYKKYWPYKTIKYSQLMKQLNDALTKETKESWEEFLDGQK